MPDRSLEGRVALVTGSSRGIGLETARLLAAHGASVVLNGRSADLVAQSAAEIAAEFGVRTWPAVFDVANATQVGEAFRGIHKEFGRLDVLVNNAGILRDALLGMISSSLVDETFATNTIAAIYCMQEAARLMMRKKSGSIINVSSIIGVTGNEGQVAYAASKAALIGATRSAAKELAPRGIRVNAVAPGFIDTEMTKQLPPDKYAQRLASVKMGRIGTPADVANVVLFLASDQSAYVTGQVIGVDGGMLI